MGLFGWRLTNKQPEAESEEVKHLHALLKQEEQKRVQEEKASLEKEAALKTKLKHAKEQEALARNTALSKNKAQAIIHLRVAERYYEQLSQCKGARQSEIKALVDLRLERAENLGVKLNGTITETINRLL